MMKSKTNRNAEILQYTGVVLIVLSLVEIILEILNVLHLDLMGISAAESIAGLFFWQAGNAAVQMIFSFVGLFAGIVAFALSTSGKYNQWLRWLGIALIAIYLIEGAMLLSQPSMYSWIRVIFLLVIAGIYVFAAMKPVESEPGAY
ncbi:hypothetical protein [Ileibacterium valens]|uniref:DUF2127 domain-containing protein n=1 Tax=Ileibacterium valens TaxID=1862668 RepID=A0A1U7NEP5_9FIRM|nr:hypothetical protein [Ileibacterium valens]OLU38237.1 hypothetical protein BO222_08730 [Ileibacterium valens]OLU40926.1 hypothetical protein BM735_04830 [Erysipelotrichaceae bacterium NYU-BL-F16]OLU42758.1 hypothetical protein BO224_01380 [Erysipelotrichaceae bacterium NYU-BL-E8]